MSKKKLCERNHGLSDTVRDLDSCILERYIEKTSVLGIVDPYNLPADKFTMLHDCLLPEELPDLAYPDIYNYLINKTSAYTCESMKAFKSLEAYKYFVAGWVHQLKLWKCKENFLVMARVSYTAIID
jgi:hypothetical protein